MALTPEEVKVNEAVAYRKTTRQQYALLAVGGMLMLLLGAYAPASFMQHFIVFVLACLCWLPSHLGGRHTRLHTPLMAVTNAISSSIVVGGAVLQSRVRPASLVTRTRWPIAVFIAGDQHCWRLSLVTRRMLAMFQKS